MEMPLHSTFLCRLLKVGRIGRGWWALGCGSQSPWTQHEAGLMPEAWPGPCEAFCEQ